jgi:hypothetical protein
MEETPMRAPVEELAETGFAIVPNVLSHEEIADLISAAGRVSSMGGQGGVRNCSTASQK